MGQGRATYIGKGGAELWGQDGWGTAAEIAAGVADILFPSSVNKGDLLILAVTYRNYVDTPTHFMLTPAGWTLDANIDSGGGGGQVTGRGVVCNNVFHKIADGTESGGYQHIDFDNHVGVALNHTMCYTARIYQYRKPADHNWSVTAILEPFGFATSISRYWNTYAETQYGGSIYATVNDVIFATSAVNNRYISFSPHRVHGVGVTISNGTEIEDYDNGNQIGCRMTSSTSIVTAGTASSDHLWYTMTGSTGDAYSPAGSTVMLVLRVIPWPNILRKNYGGSWKRWSMNRQNPPGSGNFIPIDNGYGSGGILKVLNSGTFLPTSVACVYPSSTSMTFSGDGGSISNTIVNGHGLTFYAAGGWLSATPSYINGTTTVSITAAPNPIGNPARTDTIYAVVDGEAILCPNSTISVSQGISEPYAYFDSVTTNIQESYNYSYYTYYHNHCYNSYINVYSNTTWTATIDGSTSTSYVSISQQYDNYSYGNGKIWFNGIDTYSSYVGQTYYLQVTPTGGYPESGLSGSVVSYC